MSFHVNSLVKNRFEEIKMEEQQKKKEKIECVSVSQSEFYHSQGFAESLFCVPVDSSNYLNSKQALICMYIEYIPAKMLNVLT